MFSFLFFLLGASPNAVVDDVYVQYYYECRKATHDTDSYVNKAFWDDAPYITSPINLQTSFVDLKTGEPAALSTRAKMRWDDSCLYVMVELDEPNLWAAQKQDESRVYLDNAFELFIDPDGDGQNYVEFEINALATTWDLLMPKTYKAGGDAISCYDMRGVRKTIVLKGTLNDSNDRDKGWRVYLAIPFENFRGLCPNYIPKQNDVWRMNLARVEWALQAVDGGYVKAKNPDTGKNSCSYWVWSPHGEINMHKPEKFGYVIFK